MNINCDDISHLISLLNNIFTHNFISIFFTNFKEQYSFISIFHKEKHNALAYYINLSVTSYLLKHKSHFLTNLAYVSKETSIKRSKEFIILNKLFALRNVVISKIFYYQKRKILLFLYYKQWKGSKFHKKISTKKSLKIIKQFTLERLNISSEIYSNAYYIKSFYKKLLLHNYYCDVMYVNSISFLKSVFGYVMAKIKPHKITFILAMSDQCTNEAFINKVRMIYNEIETHCINNDISVNEYKRNSVIKGIPKPKVINSLIKLLMMFNTYNKSIARVFYKWKFTNLKLSIYTKIDYKSFISEKLLLGTITILIQMISITMKQHFLWFVFQAKRKIHSQMHNPFHKTIYDLEIITNQNLLRVLKAAHMYTIVERKLQVKDFNNVFLRKMIFNLWYLNTIPGIQNKTTIQTLKIFDELSAFIERKKYTLKQYAYIQIKIRSTCIKHKRTSHEYVNGIAIINRIIHRYKQRYMMHLMLMGNNIRNNNSILNMKFNVFMYVLQIYVCIIHREPLKEWFNVFRKHPSNFTINNNNNNNKDINVLSPFSFGHSPRNSYHNNNPRYSSSKQRITEEMDSIQLNCEVSCYELYSTVKTLIKVITAFALCNAFHKMKALFVPPKVNVVSKRKCSNNKLISKRIIENMCSVALSMHNELTNKMRIMKAMLKMNNVIERNKQKIQMKHNAHRLKWYFILWKTPVRIVLNLIKDNDFQRDLKSKIEEYQESIDQLENKLYMISCRSEKCKKCSELLKQSALTASVNYTSNEPHVNHPGMGPMQQPKVIGALDEDELEDIDSLDDDVDNDEYYDFLEKTENEAKNKIIQLKTTKEPICEALKIEVENLCKEIEMLSSSNNNNNNFVY